MLGVDPETSTISGSLLCRCSTRSLLTKAWKPLFFCLHVREGSLAVYRTADDMRKGVTFAKKHVALDFSYVCSGITVKEYKKQSLHHFSISETMDYVRSTLAHTYSQHRLANLQRSLSFRVARPLLCARFARTQGPSLKYKFAAESADVQLLRNLRTAAVNFIKGRRANRMRGRVEIERQERRRRSESMSPPSTPTRDQDAPAARQEPAAFGVGGGVPFNSPPPQFGASSTHLETPKPAALPKSAASPPTNRDSLSRFDKWGTLE
jgi:hypothetical protein